MKKLIIPSMFLLLMGCTSPTVVTTRPLDLEISHPADPAGVQMLPINLRIITPENLEEFVGEVQRSQGATPVFIAITTGDFDNLIANIGDLRRYISQQQAIIVYYRQMTTPALRAQ